MEFRPCIDIHNGKVKQIVGGSLTDQNDHATENFVSGEDASFYAHLYKNANIFLPRKYEKYLELRRLALQSPRTARLLAGKIGKDLVNVDTEVTTA